MKNIIWLDLEETLIDQWGQFNLLDYHIKNIKLLIHQIKPDELGVWSFAIWSEKDINTFNTNGIKEQLEQELNYKFNSIFSIEEIREIVQEYEGFKYENVIEFIQLNGKHWSFVKYAFLHKDTNFYLIDDCVPNMRIENTDNNVKVNLINVETGFPYKF